MCLSTLVFIVIMFYRLYATSLLLVHFLSSLFPLPYRRRYSRTSLNNNAVSMQSSVVLHYLHLAGCRGQNTTSLPPLPSSFRALDWNFGSSGHMRPVVTNPGIQWGRPPLMFELTSASRYCKVRFDHLLGAGGVCCPWCDAELLPRSFVEWLYDFCLFCVYLVCILGSSGFGLVLVVLSRKEIVVMKVECWNVDFNFLLSVLLLSFCVWLPDFVDVLG